ncbi:MAG: alpha/beta fold hydrolase [Pseudomonadota bacterium]
MRWFWLALLYLASGPVVAEPIDGFDPVGYWKGAIVKDGAVFPVEIEIARNAEGLAASTRFPDWLFYEPFGFEKVIQTSDGLTIIDLLEGDAKLLLEPRFEQLVGTVGDDGRTIHLKRSPPPPRETINRTEISFESHDGTRLAATLVKPLVLEPLAGMVIVRGRGCATRITNTARFFARYGIAVLTYDKRGSGKSEGNCATFTFDQLTEDAIAALEFLADDPDVDADKVGFIAQSAGAWVIQASAERQRSLPNAISPAFLITWIGPATSIVQQQLSSAATYGDTVGLSVSQQNTLAEVTRITVDESLTDDQAFAKLDTIRRTAEQEGWLDQGFGADDIPRQREDMSRLWLRRFRYDPTQFLQGLGGLPYLAIFGARDPIVPLEENIAALRDAGSEIQVVVRPESGHGYDFDEQDLALSNGSRFWLFEGPDTGFTAETIRFLRDNGFMKR